jgi:hypothetical protein
MRHPWDFWKGILCADIFIYVVYLFFGVFVYSYQSQYAFNPVMQGLSPYNWQTATNIMNIVTGLIAACLYGNIGIKVAYVEVFQELLHAPPLTTKTGKFLWVALVPAYWALAWVVCAAIPQFSYISGLVGAVCILTRTYNRIDTGVKRWRRGFKVKWHLNTFNFFLLSWGAVYGGSRNLFELFGAD